MIELSPGADELLRAIAKDPTEIAPAKQPGLDQAKNRSQMIGLQAGALFRSDLFIGCVNDSPNALPTSLKQPVVLAFTDLEAAAAYQTQRPAAGDWTFSPLSEVTHLKPSVDAWLALVKSTGADLIELNPAGPLGGTFVKPESDTRPAPHLPSIHRQQTPWADAAERQQARVRSTEILDQVAAATSAGNPDEAEQIADQLTQVVHFSSPHIAIRADYYRRLWMILRGDAAEGSRLAQERAYTYSLAGFPEDMSDLLLDIGRRTLATIRSSDSPPAWALTELYWTVDGLNSFSPVGWRTDEIAALTSAAKAAGARK